MYKYTGCYWKVQTHLQRLWEEKGLINLIEWFVGRLVNHIYENPVQTTVDLMARILSVCAKIKKKKKIRQVHLRPNAADIVRHF